MSHLVARSADLCPRKAWKADMSSEATAQPTTVAKAVRSLPDGRRVYHETELAEMMGVSTQTRASVATPGPRPQAFEGECQSHRLHQLRDRELVGRDRRPMTAAG